MPLPKWMLEAAKLKAARKKGTGSFFLDIFGSPLLKRPALSEAVAKYRRGLTKADEAAGARLAKVPGLRKIFTEETRTPVFTSKGGVELAQVEQTPRATAPLLKAQRFTVPILAYEGLRRIAESREKAKASEKGAGETTMTRDEQAVLMKAAGVIEQLGKEREILIDMVAQALHEKQASALARDMAQKGLIAQDELDKKAQELSKENDLGIVKKAIDLAQNGFELGKLEKRAAVEGDEAGSLDPMTDYLVNYIQGR